MFRCALLALLFSLLPAEFARAAATDANAADAAPTLPDTPAPESPAPGNYLTLTFENDIFVAQDDGYTAGLQLSWARGPFVNFGGDNTTPLLTALAPAWIKGGDDYLRGVSHKVVMLMLTPRDLRVAVPAPGEQPYAGVLYWRTDVVRFNDQHADRAWLSLGLVGPASGAEQAQTLIHHFTASENPRGWDTQLRNEPVFAVGAARQWRHWLLGDDERGMDAVLLAAGSLGNLETQLDGGVLLRGGHAISRSFPTASLLPGRDVNPLAGSPRIAANIFAGILWRYQVWTVVLDGNLDGNSGSTVNRRPNQYYYAGGVTWSWGDLGFLLSVAKSSRLFKEAPEGDSFGSLSLTWRYD